MREHASRFLSDIIRKWIRDRCLREASSLAFQTVLSIVPLLAIMLASIRATGLMNVESSLVDFLSRNLIPISREDMAARFLELSENISFRSLGTVGLVVTLVLAFLIFNSTESTFNHIWRVKRRRSMAKKVIVSYLMITLIPILLGVSLYYAALFGFKHGAGGAAISISLTFVALFVAFILLPACPVRIGPAAIGALVSTIGSEVAKLPFSDLLSDMLLSRYAGIYGAVAAIPLLFVWIYWAWVTTLLGVEVTYAVQHRFKLTKRARHFEGQVHECPECECLPD